MGLFSKLFHGFFYVVDKEALRNYMENDLKFALEHNLEAISHFNLYLNGEKTEIQVWNHAASSFKDEQEKGLIVYYNKEELKTIDELFSTKLNNLPEYFKIELIDSDDKFLNEYKKSHPELNVEDY